MKSSEFVVVDMVRDDKNGQPFVRKETLRVDNIESIREWHNKGKQVKDTSLPMSQIILKSPIKDDNDETKKLFKILVVEDYALLNEAIGAVSVSGKAS